MEPVKAGIVAGEGKAVTSIRPQLGESCDALCGADPIAGEKQ